MFELIEYVEKFLLIYTLFDWDTIPLIFKFSNQKLSSRQG